MVKVLFGPVQLGFVALTLVGTLLGQPPLAILGFLGWIGSVAAIAALRAQEVRKVSSITDLSPESRSLVRPIRDLRDELEKLVSSGNDSASINVIGGDAVVEADRILGHATKLAEIRSDLKKTLRGKSEAQVKLSELDALLNGATSDEERHSITFAMDAHKKEIEHYAQIEGSIASIDAKIRQAEASLSELKSRIAVGAAESRASEPPDSDLSEMVGRLKSLGNSFEEAESMFQVQEK